MTQARRRLSALGVSLLAAFGLATFAAEAQSAPQYYREGVLVPETGIGLVGEGTSFAFRVPAFKLVIACESEADELTIKNKLGVGLSSGKISLTGCSAEGLPACSFHEPIQFNVQGQLFAHANEVFHLFEPLENGVFGQIKALGAACPLSPSTNTTGVIVALMEAGEGVSHGIYFTEGIQTLSCKVFEPCSFKYGLAAAFLDGISTERLGVPFATKKWSVQ